MEETMNNLNTGTQLSRLNPVEDLTTLAEHLRAITEKVNGHIPLEYRRALACKYYGGGWASSPELPPNAFEQYSTWLLSGARGPSEGHKSVIGANKLWMLIDQMCGLTSYDLTNSLELRQAPGTSYWQFVAGGTLSFTFNDQTIRVYGGKDRTNLKGEATYDDKFLEVSIDGIRYRIRAVDNADTSHIVYRITRERTKGELAKAQKVFVEALQHIHHAVEEGEVRFEPELFDKDLTATALEELGKRLRKM